MSLLRKIVLSVVVVFAVVGLLGWWLLSGSGADLSMAETSGLNPKIVDPNPQTIPTIGTADPIGWKAGESPVAAQGLTVSRFAEGLEHPRTITVLANGDVLVAETNSPPRDFSGISGWVMKKLMTKVGAAGDSPNIITLLRDADHDGKAETKIAMRHPALNSPFGMVWRQGRLIIANTDAVLSFPFQPGDTQLTGTPEKLMDLPGGGNHWARNLLLSPDGNDLYVTVGSSTNIADNGIEAEKDRAAIHEYDFTKKTSRIFAAGLRNPNGLDFNPATGELWTTVNERDMLGSDIVPDYLTNVPLGANYGWPWFYWKKYPDGRVNSPMPQYLNDYVRKPEYALGPHVAALGLAFSRGGNRMGPAFSSGAFVARHGSWNRKPLAGYDVVFVRFDANGNPLGKPVPVLTGFLTGKDNETHGRPVWLAWDKPGALLVSDDTAGVIWRVMAPGAKPLVGPKPVVTDHMPVQKGLTDPTTRYEASLGEVRNEMEQR